MDFNDFVNWLASNSPFEAVHTLGGRTLFKASYNPTESILHINANSHLNSQGLERVYDRYCYLNENHINHVHMVKFYSLPAWNKCSQIIASPYAAALVRDYFNTLPANLPALEEYSVHLDHFIKMLPLANEKQPAVGCSVDKYAKSVQKQYQSLDLSPCQFPAKQLTRQQVYDYCHDKNEDGQFRNDIVGCFLVIMAWGGANRRHVALLLANPDKTWETVLNNLRLGNYSRRDAYEAFFNLRTNGNLPGVGPSYYTKLIYFLRPKHQSENGYIDMGYIMDQWTAKSMNILQRNSVVRLNTYGLVLDTNTADEYEDFCQSIDTLTSAINTNLSKKYLGDDIEVSIFSIGGRHPGAWRKYLRMTWQYPLHSKP